MNTKISANQLFVNIVFFEYGTAVLFFIAPETKQDSWIATLIYIFPAILLQIIYTSIWKKYPQDTLVTYLPKIFGKFLGKTLSFIYILYFMYISARVVRDFSELIRIAAMPKMPLFVVATVIIIINVYGVFKGIENISRLAQLFFPFILIYFAASWLFIITTPGALKLHNLKPILEHGIIPVILEGWPLITFPFCESLLFAMFYSSVVENTKVRKATVLATIFIGIVLSLNNIMFISVLGVDFASTSLFPLLQTLRVMNIGETFDRLDIFVIIFLTIGGFFKISLFLYGAMLGTAQLKGLKETKWLALPLGIIVLIASMLIAKNYPQHIKIGLDFTVKYIHVPLLIIVPIITLLVYYLKLLFKKGA